MLITLWFKRCIISIFFVSLHVVYNEKVSKKAKGPKKEKQPKEPKEGKSFDVAGSNAVLWNCLTAITSLLFVALGLGGIIWGGNLVVDNAVILAEKLHIGSPNGKTLLNRLNFLQMTYDEVEEIINENTRFKCR